MRSAVPVLLALALAACERAPDAVAPDPAAARPPQPTAAGEERIGPGVLEAVRAGGSAAVVVAFELPATEARAATGGAAGLARLTRAVETARGGVLAGLAESEITVRRRYAAVPAVAVTARSESALRRLASDARVRRIDLDEGGVGTLAASVPRIGADRRHGAGNRGDGVVVAIFDSGVDADHPDLADGVAAEACFGRRSSATPGVGFCPDGTDRQTGPGAAADDAGHGTHVAGIVTSNGRVGAPGVAPGARVVAVKVLDGCSFSGCFSAFSEIVAALDYVITNNAELGVQVINMSLGTNALFAGACDNTTAFNMAGAAAVNTLRGMGVLTVASAGNSGSGTAMGSPACLSNVISVGATDPRDAVALFSNSNPTTDLFAPGVAITSLARGGGTRVVSGTSMAAPHVAGCAALLIEAGDATTPDALEARLETSDVRVTDPKNGLSFPRLDCAPRATPAPTSALLIAANAGRCLDVRGESREPGTALIIWDCHGQVNQRFVVPGVGETGELRVQDDMCVDAEGASSADGTRIIAWPCHGGENQRWTRTAAGEFRGVGGKCLDVVYADTANDTPIILHACNGGTNQRWEVRPAAE